MLVRTMKVLDGGSGATAHGMRLGLYIHITTEDEKVKWK